MPAKSYELNHLGIVQVYKRRGSKSIRLSFDSKGNVRVSIPHFVPYQAGVQFALQRADWIAQHRPGDRFTFKHGDKIGKAHRLIVIASPLVSSVQVRLKDTTITVKYPSALSENDPKVQAAAERGAKKALWGEAERLLPQRLQTLATAHGFQYRSVTVKQIKSKWGSCNQNHEITLNYYLMQLPWRLIDYVLMHELVHTEHLNHSQAFWDRFEDVLPDAKKIRKDLKPFKTAVTAG
jgi:predicted metal-dependent hydrolase